MRTVILAGGIGYRLKEETEFKPKPMILIGNKPIIWHIMKIYSHYGFSDFIIALGYKGNYIKQYFLNQKHLLHDFTIHTRSGKAKIHKNSSKELVDDFKITFVDTGENTLPGERILRIKNFIPENDKEFMVTYGDGVSDIDINKLIKFHRKCNTIGTVTGVHPRSKYGRISVNSKGTVTEFIEKPVLNEWVSGGFMIFNKDFFKYLNEGEMEHEGLKRLVEKRQLSLYLHKGFWHAMDTYNDVDTLNNMWVQNPKWKVWRE